MIDVEKELLLFIDRLVKERDAYRKVAIDSHLLDSERSCCSSFNDGIEKCIDKEVEKILLAKDEVNKAK